MQIKLKRFKQFFKGWGFNVSGQQKKTKNDIHNELMALELDEEDAHLSLEQMLRKVYLRSEMMKILEQEELYWYKRSHEQWLHEGDMNTKYFQRIANGRKRKNTIISLKSDSGMVSLKGMRI